MSTDDTFTAPLVVIVDDEVDIATYLRLALEEHGYRVAAYSDAKSAEAALEASNPAVICLDLLMPEHSGLSLYKSIQQSPRLRRCPVVIISGLAMLGDLPELLERAGGLPMPQAYIDKPINIEDFISAIERLLAAASGGEP